MNNYKRLNLILIIVSLSLVTFLSFLSFTSIQKEIEETDKIDAFFADFEDLNQYIIKDSLTPRVITYSQLKDFNENDNYANNRKDISKSVSTFSQVDKVLPKKTHYDVSSRITTYSSLKKVDKSKRKGVSSIVTVYKEKPQLKTKAPVKTSVKRILVTKSNKSNKKTKPAIQKPIKKSIASFKEKAKKTIVKKAIVKSTNFKKPIAIKKTPKKAIIKKVKKQTDLDKKPITQAKVYQKEKRPTLHYKNTELNKATNINFIQYTPVYPSCDNDLSEGEKKSCLLTKVSQFVLDNFNANIGKKSGLKKGFYEIRVLFIIDENGLSKTYKVLGKYNMSIKNEIRRIINNLPQMIPGKSNGKNVPVKYSVKVLFEVKS